MSKNHCWGCGKNEHGLGLQSYWDKEDKEIALSEWYPKPHFKAGPDHILNGGIIATLLDCHSVCTAVAYKGRELGHQILDEIWYVTGSIEIKYLKPTSIKHQLKMKASIIATQGRKVIVDTKMISQGEVTAEAKTVAIRVDDGWRTE